jgi:hypothetical protein
MLGKVRGAAYYSFVVFQVGGWIDRSGVSPDGTHACGFHDGMRKRPVRIACRDVEHARIDAAESSQDLYDQNRNDSCNNGFHVVVSSPW